MCALVKGMTDILTPINLLPNNNVLRDGGQPSTISLSSADSNHTYMIAEDWVLLLPSGASMSNVTIFRGSDSSFTISGHVDSTSSTSDYIFCLRNTGSTGFEIYNGKYTFRCNINSYTNVNYVYMGVNASALRTLYNSTFKPGVYKCVKTYGTTNGYCRPGVYVNTDSGIDFSIKVSHFAVYQGTFTDPPYYESLDARSTNMFTIGEHTPNIRTGACLIRYMASAVDTSAALTTANCIKDISGNNRHTCYYSNYNTTIEYDNEIGKIFHPNGTSSSTYGSFNSYAHLGPVTDDGNFDQISIFGRFRYLNNIVNPVSKGVSVGFEFAAGSVNGQNSRITYPYISASTNTIGYSCAAMKLDTRSHGMCTLTQNHTYAYLVQYSIKDIGQIREFVFDITDNKYIREYYWACRTREQGNSIVIKSGTTGNLPIYLYCAAGACVQLMECSVWSSYLSKDNFEFLIDSYDPSLGAAYLGV